MKYYRLMRTSSAIVFLALTGSALCFEFLGNITAVAIVAILSASAGAFGIFFAYQAYAESAVTNHKLEYHIAIYADAKDKHMDARRSYDTLVAKLEKRLAKQQESKPN